MNSINVVIVNPKFIAAFMGTPLICCWLVAEALAVGVGSSTDVALMFGGALTLIVGEFLETLVCHIPKNDALAAHKGGNDADVWARYYTSWTAWNHVRMLASMITVACLSYALQERAARLAVLGDPELLEQLKQAGVVPGAAGDFRFSEGYVLVQMDGTDDALELPVEVASHIFLVDDGA